MVLYVDGRNELHTSNQRERERVNPHTMVGKTFYSPVLHEEDERPRSEGVGKKWFPRRGEESKCGVLVVCFPSNHCLS